MAENYYIFGGIFMKFKNGFKVGMVIASPIVLMSTYAAPCFAESTSVPVTSFYQENVILNFENAGDYDGDAIFTYGDNANDQLTLLNDFTFEGPSDAYTGIKFTSDGLKKIYGITDDTTNETEDVLDEDKDIKIKVGTTEIGKISFKDCKDIGVTSFSNSAASVTLETAPEDSDKLTFYYYDDSDTVKSEDLNKNADYSLTDKKIEFTSVGLKKIYNTFTKNGSDNNVIEENIYVPIYVADNNSKIKGQCCRIRFLSPITFSPNAINVTSFDQANVSLTANSDLGIYIFSFDKSTTGVKNTLVEEEDYTLSNNDLTLTFTQKGLKKIYGEEKESIDADKDVKIYIAREEDAEGNPIYTDVTTIKFKASAENDNNSTGSSSSDSEGNSNGSSSNAGSSSSKTSGTKRGSGTRTGEAFMGLQGLAAMISAGLGLFISKRRKK